MTHTPTETPTGIPTPSPTPPICAAGGTLTDPLDLCKPAYQTPDWHLWVNGNMDIIASLFDATTGFLKPEYGQLPAPEAAGQVPFVNEAATQYGIGSLYFRELDDGAGYFGLNVSPSTQQFHLDLSDGDYDSRFIRLDAGSGRLPFFIGQRLNDDGIPVTGEWSLGFNSIPRTTTAVPEVEAGTSWSLDLTQSGFSVRYTPLLSTTYHTGIKVEPGVAFLGASVPPAAGVFTDDPQSAWHVPDGYYLQAEDHNDGPPPDDDCDEEAEFGRVSFDEAADEMCWCGGNVGWRCFGGSELTGEATYSYPSPLGHATGAINVPGVALDWTCSGTFTNFGTANPFLVIAVRPFTNGYVNFAMWDITGNLWTPGTGTVRVRCTK